jgi:glutathione S-transferase
LERQLEGKTYLTGERFTIVDAYAYVVLNWTNYHKIDVDPWPGLKTFLQRVKERPAVQQARREEGLPV